MYSSGERAGLDFVDSHGEQIAVLTVNVPELGAFPANIVAIKDYSENEGVLAQLVALGIVEPTGDVVRSGFVRIPLAKILKEELL